MDHAIALKSILQLQQGNLTEAHTEVVKTLKKRLKQNEVPILFYLLK